MSDRTDEEGVPGTIYVGPSGITQGTPGVVVPPVGAQYIVLASDVTLTAERVLTAGVGVTLTDAGAGLALTVAATGAAAPDALTFPGQSASIPATVIAAGAADGLYLLVATIDVSAVAAAGTVSAEAQYTNSGARTATAIAADPLTATGPQAGSAPFHHTGGDITVSATCAGLIGVPTFAAAFRLVRLG